MKVVRTDSELQVPRTDAALRERGVNLVLLPEGTSEARLAQEVASADLLLMCYAKVTRNVIEGAARLRAIVKYGVGIDAIDLAAALDVYGQEPVIKAGHPLSALYAMDNVIVSPHLTFYTEEAMQRLEDETLRRCVEALEGKPLTVRWHDPRLRAQTRGVRFDPP